MRHRAKTEINKWETKADRALQDFYRAKYPTGKCESCGKQFNIMHHYVEKHLSFGLRFDKDNLIFLCNSCHTRHHLSGDEAVMYPIIKKRGIKWLDKLNKKRIETKNQVKSIEFYKKTYEYYEKKTIKLSTG